MKPVARAELLDIAEYERRRADSRPRFIALKARRRTPLGPHMTVLWENRDTARYQIQEMMRSERMVDERAIRHELDTYNELVPGEGELKATLLIEYPDVAARDAALAALVGLEEHVRLGAGGATVAASFDRRQMSATRLSSVQFLTFHLDAPLRGALLAGEPVALEVTHPAYRARAPLTAAVRQELRSDLLTP